MFADRREAGRSLARLLADERDPVVLGVARGGIIVGHTVAMTLGAAFDIVVIRKVGHPLQPELALGAVSADGDAAQAPFASEYFQGALAPLFDAQVARARDLDAALRGSRAQLSLAGRCVIIVDDGIATSATMECAVEHARRGMAARIVCAAPVGPAESIEHLRHICDGVAVVVVARERDFAVGRYYLDFREVDDRRVLDVLAQPPTTRG